MIVFEHAIEIGERRFFSVPVGSYGNGAPVTMPVLVLRGRHPGPTLWVAGEVHGEELNGSIAAWEYFSSLSTEQLHGSVVLTPISNPLALADRNKICTIDCLDMDTAFPGNKTGTWTQRVAAILYEGIRAHANYLISFHTLASRQSANPYTVSKIVQGADTAVIDRSWQMALAFGVEPNCVVDLANAVGELPGVTSGALDITCMRDGIPAFMAEIGYGAVGDGVMLEKARRGLENLLCHLEMTPGCVVLPERQIRITKRKFLRADEGGLISQMYAVPGTVLKAGEPLARTHYFDGHYTNYTVSEDSYILAARKHPMVHTGERLAFVGTQWEIADNSFIMASDNR